MNPMKRKRVRSESDHSEREISEQGSDLDINVHRKAHVTVPALQRRSISSSSRLDRGSPFKLIESPPAKRTHQVRKVSEVTVSLIVSIYRLTSHCHQQPYTTPSTRRSPGSNLDESSDK